MNKATLISTINGFVTAIITQLKLRNAYLELINIFFSTTIVKSNTPASNQFTYNLKFNKRGNKVHVTGWIRNDFTTAKSSTIVFTNDNTSLYCKTSNDTIFFAQTTTSKTNVLCSYALQNIFMIDALPSGDSLTINTNYLTND
jgi:hypothetical protein